MHDLGGARQRKNSWNFGLCHRSTLQVPRRDGREATATAEYRQIPQRRDNFRSET
ncbi:MAG: hypothetical protein NVS2B11_17780 [Acetobacteraceae bacterium]